MAFYAYIVASQRNGTLYTGSTDDLPRRIEEHRGYFRDGFTANTAARFLSGTRYLKRATPRFAASGGSRNGGDLGNCS